MDRELKPRTLAPDRARRSAPGQTGPSNGAAERQSETQRAVTFRAGERPTSCRLLSTSRPIGPRRAESSERQGGARLSAIFVILLRATHAVAPAGGGLASLDVRVDLKRASVQYGGAEVPIALERAELPDDDDVSIEVLAVGQGRHVVHVRVPVRGSDARVEAQAPAWEALFAAGRAAPLFAGRTGLLAGDPGERTGTALQIVPNGASNYVLVGDLREDLRICGQSSTLLDPRALYPASLDLRPATVQRLGADERARAEGLVATDKGDSLDAPLAKLLTARGSSVGQSRGVELTDGNVDTTWQERRPGAGQGEFVVMAAPKEVPIARLQFALSPRAASSASSGGADAAPKTFFLVTDTRSFEIMVPEEAARKPGEVYEVTFPQPIEASCLSLVLGDAYAHGMAHPDVGLAELVAYSEFDSPGTTLDDVAQRLSGPRGGAAAQVLERAQGALAAVSKAYGKLDAGGRALAIDVAASGERCDEAAPLLAHAICDAAGDKAEQSVIKAREKLARCSGAGPALAQELRGDASSRACVAPMLAALAPREALEPLADAMAETPESDPKTRAALRAAFGEALGGAPAGNLAALVGDGRRSAASRLEMLRAADARVAEVRDAGDAVLAELAKGSPTMRVRYLVLGPLGVLAHAGDSAARGRVVSAMAHDADWPVRAHAAEIAAGLPGAEGALVAAASDPEPRVREAALAALAGAVIGPDAVRAALSVLGVDDWSFVKTQAVAVLASAPPRRDVDDAVGRALADVSARVRGAVLSALARRHASSWRDAIRRRLDDKDEDADVRAAAASALGELCDAESVGRLTELTRPLRGVAADEDAREIGLGALVGLAALHPRDLNTRLAPLLAPGAPPAVRVAAAQAVAGRGVCPGLGQTLGSR
jgi:hypothetical protein